MDTLAEDEALQELMLLEQPDKAEAIMASEFKLTLRTQIPTCLKGAKSGDPRKSQLTS